MKNPSYYVKDGHTLGYVDPRQPNKFCPIGAMVTPYSHQPKNGPVAFDPNIDKVAPATRDDFDRFRVLPPPGLFAEEHEFHEDPTRDAVDVCIHCGEERR